ncbi:competence type IV pilus minor pilin ComGF [Oceanobacillus halotolerans]|uniref:competence type IV pilus minor pilin ComGF n=1 Tax=Oceanobacillus halotolerans TaxID=2663380 RepID=UPI0013D959D8|nr:ComGF family competence protein [Oceanobacillus halotolerans]
MQKWKTIKSACTDPLQNEKGITFITILFSITILFLTLPFITSFLKISQISSYNDELTIHQFFHFLRDEVIAATNYEIEGSTLELEQSNGSQVTIEVYHNQIRRRVNSQGHEVFLRDIKDALFTKLPYGIRATITTLQGDTYEKEIIFYP